MAQEGRNTFASKVKGEISRNKGLIARNKKAFTYGMLLCGKSFSEQSISMTTENKHVAKLYAKLIFQQIPMQTSVTTRNRPGIRMSHQLLDKSARSAWLSSRPTRSAWTMGRTARPSSPFSATGRVGDTMWSCWKGSRPATPFWQGRC